MSIATHGSAHDPAVLLIGGAAASMDWWPPDFCALLTNRYVIRYDHRDTGDAPSYPPGKPGYTGQDLLTDAVAVLDSLNVAAAHVVGISMGGALAQEMALYHPERVRSLTAISTTAGAGDPDLPGMAELSFPPEPDWSDTNAVIEYQVASQKAVSGAPFDEEEIRTIATLAASRTTNQESAAKNHYAAEDPGGSWRHRLPEITVPTLILHGDVDPLFPLPHGEALAREIPGARLVVLPNTGHEFPSRIWPLAAKEILALTAGG